MSNFASSDVASFYSGKSVFITGGSGFLGKTLIEKLLYSCRGIDKIYVLVRDKNEKSARVRLARMINTPVFDRLKSSRNEDLKKVMAIAGDITCKNLGLTSDILKCLEDEVSVVFHLAASVAFNLGLRDAMRINIDGTEEVINICHRMKKLQAFVHVSTAFTNSDRYELKEQVYPMHVSLESAREIAQTYSDDDRFIKVFMGKKPNTYTFSKAFGEELVMKQCEELPVVIVRPTIVISSLKEPCPGWIDSWNGSTGLFVGVSTGALRVIKGKGKNVTDLVPVDIVTNLLIVAATRCQRSKTIKVYNCCTGTSNPITCKEASVLCKKVTLKYSLNEIPWPYIIFTSSELLYTILTFILQILPAYLIDLCCLVTGRKTEQVKLQEQFKKVVDAVKFFLLNEWKFSDDNMRNLYKNLSSEDKEIFSFDVKSINWESCIEDYVLGARKYLLSAGRSKY